MHNSHGGRIRAYLRKWECILIERLQGLQIAISSLRQEAILDRSKDGHTELGRWWVETLTSQSVKVVTYGTLAPTSPALPRNAESRDQGEGWAIKSNTALSEDWSSFPNFMFHQTPALGVLIPSSELHGYFHAYMPPHTHRERGDLLKKKCIIPGTRSCPDKWDFKLLSDSQASKVWRTLAEHIACIICKWGWKFWPVLQALIPRRWIWTFFCI